MVTKFEHESTAGGQSAAPPAHQLRYDFTIANEGSFTQAAEKLYIAQPSLSVQIKKLEQELGVHSQ